MLIRKFFAPDDEMGNGSIEEAMEKLTEQRAAQAKEVQEEPAEEAPKPVRAKVEKKVEQNNEPEPAPEAGDEGEQESAPEQSDEEKLAAEIAKTQTPAPDSTLPPGWRGDDDAKLWSELTPAAQQRLLKREREREAGIAQHLEKSTKASKEAEEERNALKAERQRLAPILQSTQTALLHKLVTDFPDVDPRNPASVSKFALEHPDRYPAYDALWKQIGAVAAQQGRVDQENKQREEAEFQDFAEKRVARLLELDSSLSDQEKSAAFEKDVVEYLMTGNGYGNIAPDRIKHYTAEELLIARKAHLYDKAMAALKKSAGSGKTPTGIKPGAGVEGKTEQVAALEKRLKGGKASIDDGVALMRARRKAS